MPSRFLLPASLSVNVFLAAVVATLLLGGESGPRRPSRPAAIMEEVASTLPPADAVHLRRAFAAHVADLEAADAIIRRVPDRISAELARPDFDEAKVREAFATGRQARVDMDMAVEAALVEATSRMSPAGRKRLSEWMPPRPIGCEGMECR